MPTVLRFGRFEFHPASGELIADGSLVRLEPQPAKVLAVLAARAGQVVTREELRREVWPAGVFVDFERGLNYCIRRIRLALGDSAETPVFVETLPRRGYRFLPPVAEQAEGDEAPRGETWPAEGRGAGAAEAAPPLPRRSWSGLRRLPRGRTLAVAAGVLAVLGAAAAVVQMAQPARRAARPTVAVTLFDNETGRGDLDRTAQVLTDTLVERLARDAARWSVIGNAPILRRPRPFLSLPDIASTLHADLIVLGQILPAERGLTILTHLIRARDQRHLWVGRFAAAPDAGPSDADRISGSVAGAVARHAGDPR